MKIRNLLSLFLLFSFVALTGCETSSQPKPRAFPKIDFPKKSYQVLQTPGCPMQFEVPHYAKFSQKKYFFEENIEHSCWFNLDFPHFEGSLHFSYKPLSKSYNSIDALIEDAHKLIYKHSQKATAISPEELITKGDVQGVFYKVSGDAASSTQFFLTDTENHFLRASLYLNTQINSDSLKPVIQFLREDIDHLIETFSWVD